MVIKYMQNLILFWTAFSMVSVAHNGGIFEQIRVGKNARLITIYKFRSITPSYNGSSISVLGETRITPFGAKLRRFKIDGLSEFWNALKGDMSFPIFTMPTWTTRRV